jgi:outer membrane protein
VCRVTKMTFIRTAIGCAVLALGASAGSLSAQQAATGPAKVAVIDVQRILTDSAAGRVALERLRELAKAEQANLAALDQTIKEKQAKLTEGQLSLSAEKQGELQAEIQRLRIEFSRAQDDARAKMAENQETVFGKIEEKVMPLIAQIGEEQGLTLIFNKFEDSGLLWATAGADITELVLQRFNELPGD